MDYPFYRGIRNIDSETLWNQKSADLDTSHSKIRNFLLSHMSDRTERI